MSSQVIGTSNSLRVDWGGNSFFQSASEYNTFVVGNRSVSLPAVMYLVLKLIKRPDIQWGPSFFYRSFINLLNQIEEGRERRKEGYVDLWILHSSWYTYILCFGVKKGKLTAKRKHVETLFRTVVIHVIIRKNDSNHLHVESATCFQIRLFLFCI
jgi:hypothetical protein